MITQKKLQLIDKNNLVELKDELYNRKRDLVSLKIHGTLKQDLEVIQKVKKLKQECRILSQFIDIINKNKQKELFLQKKSNEILENQNKKSKVK